MYHNHECRFLSQSPVLCFRYPKMHPKQENKRKTELPTRSPSRPLRASHAGNQIPRSSHISRPQNSCNGGYHLSSHSSCLAMGNAPNAGRDPPAHVAIGLARESGSQSMKNHSCHPGRPHFLESETHPESQCQCDRHKGFHTQRSIS